MTIKRSPIILLAAVGGGLAIIAASLFIAFHKTATELSAAPTINTIVEDVLAARTSQVLEEGAVPFGDDDVINVLVLGIDSRKEGEEQHCDAIHMFSINIETWDVKITSVPRGTTASLPSGSWKPTEYYLANACAYGGLDYGIAQIERIVGVKHDYLVTVGFSQALGVFRALSLPTTETLQWLRHRQSYAIGDPQRSHNQAVFMADLLRQFGRQEERLSSALLYVMYRFVDTDMSFGTARSLYEGFVASGRATDEHVIVHDMKPFYATTDYHLDVVNPDAQISALLDRIRPYLSKEDLSDRPIEDVQRELVTYLYDALQQPEEAQRVIDEEIWRQVEDDAAREALHFAYVSWYVTTLLGSDEQAAIDFLADYILEKQTLSVPEYEEKGRQLMQELVE